jgi:hypothetical protein
MGNQSSRNVVIGKAPHLVRALKVMNTGVYESGMWCCNLSITFKVLPVPVSPTHNTCLSFFNKTSIRNVYRTVSGVGTMICENGVSGFTAYSPTALIHSVHLPVSWSYLNSYMEHVLFVEVTVGGMCFAKPFVAAVSRKKSFSRDRPSPTQLAPIDLRR